MFYGYCPSHPACGYSLGTFKGGFLWNPVCRPKGCFYSVLRSSLFEQEMHDDLICTAMKHLGILPEEWHESKAVVTRDNATEGLQEHHAAILKDMFAGTRFTMRGLGETTANNRGNQAQ